MDKLPESIKGICKYGSQVYGNIHKDSDFDFLIITEDTTLSMDFLPLNSNYQILSPQEYQNDLNNHDIRAIETYFYLWEYGINNFKFTLNLLKLRHAISEKASHSFVKSKKKIIQNDVFIGQKSLYHSLRILMFGIQIAKYGKIIDFAEANQYWQDIIDTPNWECLKNKYQPIFNSLKSRFKQVCPEKVEII